MGVGAVKVGWAHVQGQPSLDFPCVTPPSPKRHWIAPAQRHVASERNGTESRRKRVREDWCGLRGVEDCVLGMGGAVGLGVWGIAPVCLALPEAGGADRFEGPRCSRARRELKGLRERATLPPHSPCSPPPVQRVVSEGPGRLPQVYRGGGEGRRCETWNGEIRKIWHQIFNTAAKLVQISQIVAQEQA